MTFPAFLQSEERHPICFDFSYGRTKLGRTKNCSIVWKDNAAMTFKRGTYWVQGTAWVCGPKTYYMLPPNATDDGVQLTPVQNHTIEYGAPMSHRNSNSGPLDRKYFMPCFLGWAQEIDAFRISVMQHRVALDILLAGKGGLCVLFNNTCCTYIPDNVHSSNMTDALKILRQLRDAQQQDYVTHTEDWLTWLLSGSWKSLLFKGFVLVGVLLLLLCLFTSCVIPCLKNMVSKMVTASINAYIILPRNEEDDNEIDIWI
ncbi:unnamed protein product [Oreochromis niloticus]|nr:unnamed protein product [Mustela putorius furo]